MLLQGRVDLLGLPTDGHEPAFVRDRPVVGQPVDLVGDGILADLRDDDLHLVRLDAVGEDRAEGLGVEVGQRPPGDVPAVVHVPADVHHAYARRPQVLELVVLADRGEGHPVIDLADLVQGGRGVLRDEQDAVGVAAHDHAAAARDPLAGVLGPVSDLLLRTGIAEGHGHVSLPDSSDGRRRRPRPRRPPRRR